MNRLIRYFFRGLLFVVPVALTFYIIIISIQWLDSLINVQVPGLGLLIILAIITGVGYLGSSLLARPLFEVFVQTLARVPLVNLIYTSIKDLIDAFVGDKRKFNQAVIVEMDANTGLRKMGFITQDDLEHLGMPGLVAVYLPHSYNFSGNLYILPKEQVTPLDLPGSDVMKFIVSGGVSGLNKEHAPAKTQITGRPL